MSSKFLDKTGLGTFWAKIKSKFQTLGNLVTSWGNTPSDTKYPSEKLVKDSLDAKAPNAPSEVTIANGDKIIIADASDSSKLKRASVAFDGSTEGQLLTKKGTFANPKEEYLDWGGRDRTGVFGPVDAALVSELGANRFAGGKAAGITIEYTRDGGTTWTDYGATDVAKRNIFTNKSSSIKVGKCDSTNKATTAENYAKYKTRVIINCSVFGIYNEFKKFIFYISTNGSSSCYMVMSGVAQAATTDTWTTIGEMQISGWSGYNVFNKTVNMGLSSYATYKKICFLFEARAAGDSNYDGLSIYSIWGYGGVGWTTPSTLASTGHAYSVDGSLNVAFPANVKATTFEGKFATARKLAVSLSNTSTDTSFDGSADVTNIKVSGTLPVTNGGTGKTTAKAAEYNLTTGKSEISDTTSGDDRVVFELASPSESNGVTRGFRKLSTIWTWIKGLLSSESGVNISGNAATATDLAANSVLSVSKGGTGKSSVTSNSYLKGNGTGALTERTYSQVRSDLGLGTVYSKDVPTSGNASTTQVVMGNDTRLSDSRTPTSHASPDPTYGAGDSSNYGHVKLYDSVANENTDGAPTQKAVRTELDKTMQFGKYTLYNSDSDAKYRVIASVLNTNTSSGTGWSFLINSRFGASSAVGVVMGHNTMRCSWICNSGSLSSTVRLYTATNPNASGKTLIIAYLPGYHRLQATSFVPSDYVDLSVFDTAPPEGTTYTLDNQIDSERVMQSAPDVRFYTSTADARYYKIATCNAPSTLYHIGLSLDYWASRPVAKSERGTVEVSVRPYNDGYEGINHFVAYQETKLGSVNYGLQFILTMLTSGDTTHLELWVKTAQSNVGFFASGRFNKGDTRTSGSNLWSFVEDPSASTTEPAEPTGGHKATADPSYNVKISGTSAVGGTRTAVYVDEYGVVQPCTGGALHTHSNKAVIDGISASDVTNWNGKVDGPSSATSGNFPVFDGTTGKLIKNSSYSDKSFVAIANAYARANGTANLWCKLAEQTWTYTSSQTICASWLVTFFTSSGAMTSESFFLNFAMRGIVNSGAPVLRTFSTSIINTPDAVSGRRFKMTVDGTNGSYTFKLYYTNGSDKYCSVAIRELSSATHHAMTNARSGWTYTNYSSNSGDATEPVGTVANYNCDFVYASSLEVAKAKDYDTTSGGIKTALDGKADVAIANYTATIGTDNNNDGTSFNDIKTAYEAGMMVYGIRMESQGGASFRSIYVLTNAIVSNGAYTKFWFTRVNPYSDANDNPKTAGTVNVCVRESSKWTFSDRNVGYAEQVGFFATIGTHNQNDGTTQAELEAALAKTKNIFAAKSTTTQGVTTTRWYYLESYLNGTFTFVTMDKSNVQGITSYGSRWIRNASKWSYEDLILDSVRYASDYNSGGTIDTALTNLTNNKVGHKAVSVKNTASSYSTGHGGAYSAGLISVYHDGSKLPSTQPNIYTVLEVLMYYVRNDSDYLYNDVGHVYSIFNGTNYDMALIGYGANNDVVSRTLNPGKFIMVACMQQGKHYFMN